MKKEELLKQLRIFRIVAITEGISFLVLLLIAMPLKYMLDIPEPVSVLGWIHGILFMVYIFFAVVIFTIFNKNFLWLAKAFAASLLPFGTFVLDRELKMEQQVLLRSKN
jgi:integral membrane protein